MNAEENAQTIAKGVVDTTNFNKLYERAIEKTFFAACEGSGKSPGWELAEKLAKKREVGLAKYRDSSFQFNMHNALNSPTLEHAMDELLDCMNYLLHEIMLKASLLYPDKVNDLKIIFRGVFMTYLALEKMEKEVVV